MDVVYTGEPNAADETDNHGMIDARGIVQQFKVRTTDENRLSRYRNLARILDDAGDQYIETSEPVTVPRSADDTFHIVTEKDKNRLDLVAWQYYGNYLLWWVIAEASEIRDPFDVPVDTVLRVPRKDRIFGYDGLVI